MKKIYTLIMAGLLSVGGAMAQSNPDRIIINETSGKVKAFLAERVESITFDQIEGEVKAVIDFKEFKSEPQPTIILGVHRTPECRTYKIAVVAPAYKNAISTDEGAIAYMDYFESSELYDEDFDNAQLTWNADELVAGADYTVLTVGYDKYGVACMADRAVFTTPKAGVVGNPSVSYTIDYVDYTKIKVTFTPNDDCYGYGICIFNKGTAEQQFNMWSAMMGFNTIDEMVMQFSGKTRYGKETVEWKDQAPGTDYEILVAVLDENGNYGNMVTIPVSTKSMGDDGVAEVDIKIGSSRTDYQDGKQVCVQWVTFTPNASTAMFRDMILQADAYDSPEWSGGDESVKKYLGNDDPSGMGMETPGWNLYEEDSFEWALDFNTAYYAIAWARNAKNEWGPLNKVEFTTMAAPAGAPAAKSGKATRLNNMNGNTFKKVSDIQIKRTELKNK